MIDLKIDAAGYAQIMRYQNHSIDSIMNEKTDRMISATFYCGVTQCFQACLYPLATGDI